MIRIITDSLSDITLEHAKELNIDIMCLNVRFGDEEFVCGKEMTNEQFYEKLESSPHNPASSAVNPATFQEIFQKYVDIGDDVIAIMFSSKMSATYQNAMIAADEVDSPLLHVIDSTTGLCGQALLVEHAVKMRDDGASCDEIVNKINELIPRIRVYLVVDTMEYLKRGGRISSGKAFVGSLLRVHPVMQIVADGALPVDKVKGKKSCNQWLINKLKSESADPEYPIYIGHSNALERAELFEKQMREEGIGNSFKTNCIGPIVGTHAGPNCLGIGYVL